MQSWCSEYLSCNWFESYLSNRCQVTVCNGTKSSSETVQIGVPQGSILGPLLFTLYINDLPDYLDHCDVTLYADDTVLFIYDRREIGAIPL